MNLENFVLGFFDFVGNIDFNVFGFVLAVLLLVFWLVLIGWVWIDSGERTSSIALRITYLILVIVLTIPGLIIYLIVRPSETIEQIYWADLERRYLKYETSELGACTKCGHQLLPGYVYCTNCGNEIRKKCPGCGVLINKGSKFCPYCGTQVRAKSLPQEKYPTAEVMQQQILATKEEAVETVGSNRLKYKQSASFVVKLGDMVISSWGKLIGIAKVKMQDMKESQVEKVEKNADPLVKDNESEKSTKKKKKNKKRKKK